FEGSRGRRPHPATHRGAHRRDPHRRRCFLRPRRERRIAPGGARGSGRDGDVRRRARSAPAGPRGGVHRPRPVPLETHRNAVARCPEIENRVPRPTLAVIPFTQQSGGRYRSVGEIIADEIIVALSRAPELRIVSRLSTTPFRGRTAPLEDLRALLGATYVLS